MNASNDLTKPRLNGSIQYLSHQLTLRNEQAFLILGIENERAHSDNDFNPRVGRKMRCWYYIRMVLRAKYKIQANKKEFKYTTAFFPMSHA